MSAFITRRGGASSGGETVLKCVTVIPSSSGEITVPELIGKTAFVILRDISARSTKTGAVFIRYDGELDKCYLVGFDNSQQFTYSSECATFDPTTGTLTISGIYAYTLNTGCTHYVCYAETE